MPDQPLIADQIELSSVVSVSDRIASVILDGEAVLYDEETAGLQVLNPTATVVWQCLDGSGTLAEIAADIAEVFEVDLAVVQAQVLELARDLGRKGALTGVERETVLSVPIANAEVDDLQEPCE